MKAKPRLPAKVIRLLQDFAALPSGFWCVHEAVAPNPSCKHCLNVRCRALLDEIARE